MFHVTNGAELHTPSSRLTTVPKFPIDEPFIEHRITEMGSVLTYCSAYGLPLGISVMNLTNTVPVIVLGTNLHYEHEIPPAFEAMEILRQYHATIKTRNELSISGL